MCTYFSTIFAELFLRPFFTFVYFLGRYFNSKNILGGIYMFYTVYKYCDMFVYFPMGTILDQLEIEQSNSLFIDKEKN